MSSSSEPEMTTLGKRINFKSRYVPLLFAVSLLHAQTGHTWTDTEAHKSGIGNRNLEVKDLSQSEQVQICDAIVKQWHAEGTSDTSVANERKIILNMDTTDIRLSVVRSKQLLVQANQSSGFCGATGNCSIWVFVREHGSLRLVLSGFASEVVIEKTVTRGLHDIALRTHTNVSDSNEMVYRWTGAEYRFY